MVFQTLTAYALPGARLVGAAALGNILGLVRALHRILSIEHGEPVEPSFADFGEIVAVEVQFLCLRKVSGVDRYAAVTRYIYPLLSRARPSLLILDRRHLVGFSP